MSEMIDPSEFGRLMGGIVRDAVGPLRETVTALQAEVSRLKSELAEARSVRAEPPSAEIVSKAVAEYLEANPAPAGRDGQDGKHGVDGKDAEPVDVAEVCRELLGMDELATLVGLHAAEAVGAYFEANPVKHGRDGQDGKDGAPGKDGRDGMDGAKGDRGEKGERGPEGLGLKDLFRAEGGRLMAVLSDGTTRDLGEFVGKNGKDGDPGKDGASFEGVEFGYDAETHEIECRWLDKGAHKSLRYPAGGIRQRGYWKQGVEAKAGDTYTHNGNAWVAMRDTKAEPAVHRDDWTILARKGRDGDRGPRGSADAPAGPVKLGGA